ncbi:PREDICTED: cold shock domain-containing protein E1-like isoform X2 [Priapulus caudatus]|uniref:Cold shock domain-containing protein E1-like isoform X2 n=1 Tax=Priapulus caudatus TaxID=37621 RepID=A0ABM1DVM0_PRICU|nr:PREDICTED: cold shock domain-containing protein E1-like isoform X2 [Priapulus caudatus]
MASPQWKNFQPPNQDGAILAFQRSSSYDGECSVAQSPPAQGNGIREIGVIGKLLFSYGFVQCCNRQERLFFHYSQYQGDINQAKVGDLVEFEQGVDRRTGKAIAVAIYAMPQQAPVQEEYPVLSNDRVIGTVIIVAQPPPKHAKPGEAGQVGRIQYESSGESFFLPYTHKDLVGPLTRLQAGDKVSLIMVTDKSATISDSRTGALQAQDVQKFDQELQRFHGVVCSCKDSFGFIERADIVSEIFFHYSEYKGDINELKLGEDVEFSVQDRNGKEVAVNITRLPEGSVVFETLDEKLVRGHIKKVIGKNRRQSTADPLPGRISYKENNEEKDIQYGEKDLLGIFTLHENDLVEFTVATDKRDQMQHATNIDFLPESFKISQESRETGLVAVVKDGFGFIKCAEREARMFFHFSEFLINSYMPKVQDEVEFTVSQDHSSSRPVATRIKTLSKGSISFETVLLDKYTGLVEKEAISQRNSTRSPTKITKENGVGEVGEIKYDVDGESNIVKFLMKDVDIRNVPKRGDKVEFQICEQKRNSVHTAKNIRVISRAAPPRLRGFIATLKENFGFIEALDRDKEVFFHYSSFDGDPNELEFGDELEYSTTRKNGKVSAESVVKLPLGSIQKAEVEEKEYEGKVIRPLRSSNPEQDEYAGVVQVNAEGEEVGQTYQFTVISLLNKQEFLQKGDPVTFKLTKSMNNGPQYAAGLEAKHKIVQSRVESIKGQFGFISHEVEEGKKLFFHMSEVGGGTELQAGDIVEFVVIQNQRSGKTSACSIRKISDAQAPRPERLLSRLKSISLDETQPRVVVTRQPRAPDGTQGFTLDRTPPPPPPQQEVAA